MSTLLLPFYEPLAMHVARNMRPSDREEVMATRYGDDPSALVEDIAQVPGFSWVALRDDEPCAVIGAQPLWPGVWSVYAFGTDRWRSVVLLLTRHVRRFMIPGLVDHGAHLAFCWSHAAHTEAHAWLKTLGAAEEAPLPAWGRGREDFVLFAWRR
jgi:hypothetical protein